MNMEMTAAFKQEDLCKELPIDIDESLKLESVPGGVIAEDVVQRMRSIGEPEIVFMSGRGNESETEIPDQLRNQVVHTGTHANDTGVITEDWDHKIAPKAALGRHPPSHERSHVMCTGTRDNDTGIIIEDVGQFGRSIGKPKFAVHKSPRGLGIGSDARNPHLLHNNERNQAVYTGTHHNDTEDLVKELLIDIDERLEFESVPSQCCIYRVPKTIRRVNDEVYTPQLISIGPLHHGKPELADMEKKKKKYVKGFLEKIGTKKRDQILSHIKDSEEKIRNCYAETSTLGSHKFVKMILYDSIFIMEMFLRVKFGDRSDILLTTQPVNYTLWTDLQLFENQLPYFILDEIYELAFNGDDVPTFMKLSVNFFGPFMGVGLSELSNKSEVQHFTDWRRISLLKSYPSSESKKGMVHELPSAVKLHESGLKFIKCEKKQSVLDIRLKKPKHLISFFKGNELHIPQLQVCDETELLLRNIMALEQCFYPDDAHVCNYVALMDYLINTVEDVDLLVENKIISNYMGDNASVATMFNKLNQYVIAHPSSYHYICEKLTEHYKNPWNKTRAILKRVYFNNLWRGTATVAAIILLLFTIAQTVFSILQVV